MDLLNDDDDDGTTTTTSAASGRRERLLVPEPEPFHLTSMMASSSEFPNVFEESRDMLLSAILMYGLVDLRQLIRDKQQQKQQSTTTDTTPSTTTQPPPPNDDDNDEDPLLQQLLTLPISAKDVVRLVARHRTEIETSHIGKDATCLYLNALDAIQATSSSRELEVEFVAYGGPVALVDFTVVAVEDSHVDSELVYAICVDTARRRLTVLFRGCSTRKDWSICANNILKDHINPLLGSHISCESCEDDNDYVFVDQSRGGEELAGQHGLGEAHCLIGV